MTTTTAPTFDSIDSDALTQIMGGCGKKQCRCPQPQPQPQPQQAAPAPSGPEVSTNVSISGY